MNNFQERVKEIKNPGFFERNIKAIVNVSLNILLIGVIILVIIFICSGINSCSRNDSIKSYHLLEVNYNKLPLKETPLVIADTLIFNEELNDKFLVFYYHYKGQVNKRKFIGIPLSKCIFTGKRLSYKLSNGTDKYKDPVNIEFQNDSIGKLIYDEKSYKSKDIIELLSKQHLNTNYIIHGELDSIPYYFGIIKKTH